MDENETQNNEDRNRGKSLKMVFFIKQFFVYTEKLCDHGLLKG